LVDGAVLEDFREGTSEEIEEKGKEPVEEGLHDEEDSDQYHVREIVLLLLASQPIPGSSRGLS
jgi:hypothetical protein